MELYSIPSKKLDGYIGMTLHPSEEFQENVSNAVDRICSFLKEDCNLNARVIKTVKAGSAGKGTALDMSSDVDLVIFLSCFSSFQDQAEQRERVIKDIEKNLKRCIQTIAFRVDILSPRQKGTPPRSLSVIIQAKKKTESVEVDILPAYDALGPITSTYVPPKEVYIDLIEANGDPGEFNTSFTELQRNFVKHRPPKLKDLLRLVKHWYKEIKKVSCYEREGERLEYDLFLKIPTYSETKWPHGKEAEQFNMAEGFCTVMKLIIHYQDLCFYWTKYYSLKAPRIGLHVKGKLRESRPVIIDPADPTANVAKASGEAWDLLAKNASYCLKQSCCMKNGEPIKSWDVQPTRNIEVTVKQRTGTPVVISCNPLQPIMYIKKKIGNEGHTCELYLEELGQENVALQNDKRLADYGIFYDTTIRLHLKSMKKNMIIFVLFSLFFLFLFYIYFVKFKAGGRKFEKLSVTPGSQITPLRLVAAITLEGSWVAHPSVAQVDCLKEKMELYSIPSKKLDGYIGMTLHPSEEFQENVSDAVDRICSFLKEDCDLDQDANVIKTVKAGSAGKGTAMDMSSDVDLVIFLSCFSSFKDQAKQRERVINDIEKNLKRCIQTIAFKVEIFPPRRKGTPPRSLSLLIQAKKKRESVEVDILPAYDALGPISFTYVPPKEVYIDLIEANGDPGEFNTSFTELQRNFVKRCPAKLKDLLRLVKHWYKEIKKQSSSMSPKLPPKLPPKFALELLTIYAWEEEKKGAEQFNTAEGFCTVMKLITQYQDLCFYWTKYYTLEDSKIGVHVKGKLKESRPVIIDPGDPTANVAKANVEAWDLLAQKASDCLTQSCCMKNEEPIKPWNVQPARDIEVTVKQQTGAPKVISCNPFVPIKWIKKQIGKEGCICELYLEETALQNDKRLADYGIFYNTTFRLLRITSQKMNIFVKDFNNRTTNYTVNSSETVLGLKKMIEASKHIAVNQQCLTYHDKELEDGKTLAYYDIRSNETVYLLLRLRGGHWNGMGWDGIENNN
ncbi:uncharacterized protein LOC107297389 [Protobothrops mucrosquamatus]|uniref:uncharacterized protein LOC107297389 n=1 Tax=Protobothrops mucrosquamatus TaxID=103944 RepID=UPI0010FB4299|nr:uncharacterized protein LOC107297389 [Protobothrops mucrosquamatus]